MNLTLREYEKEINQKIGRYYRCFIGRHIARFSISKNVRFEKIQFGNHLENSFPKEIIDEYFKTNPIPVKHENYEPISLEMIKLLPIRIFHKNLRDENLFTDGKNVFMKDTWIGYWKN